LGRGVTISELEEFAATLRELANLLRPLTRDTRHGALVWNGTNYATPIAESQEVEPYALGWLLTLTTISELLERQRSEPSRAQLDYVERELFGGIGSLTDFDFVLASKTRMRRNSGKPAEVMRTKSLSS
jgi:hypothetical protein